ncbi:3-oxoacid CoA-transferase subunit B [Corynebacterium breve]|uniref:3-oxoacid CoA-transferase subunit B n=1 Tax=Corynebacterium breve TaxID=3049799 RepID=A0ABY8VEU2_9CORY|nr:3-oxoacid CoA-transferase subunit B [Corynebacterium breve]WIM67627.1 3-oxoacid CoA-transferase subunit B [Corynebacterium breve]
MVNKVVTDTAVALEGMKDGDTIVMGGFGAVGSPLTLIRAIRDSDLTDLTVYSNNPGFDIGTGTIGIATLIEANKLRKFGGFYIGHNQILQSKMFSGEIEIDLIPQGTLAEKMRAGRAGIPAFFTASGVDTARSDGGLPQLYDEIGEVIKRSEPVEIHKFTRYGKTERYMLEESFAADFVLVRAWKADTEGNLVFRATGGNFNADAAGCGQVTVAEAEHVVPAGSLTPEEIDVPGIFVDRVLQLTPEQAEEKVIVFRTVRERGVEDAKPVDKGKLDKGWTRMQLAARAAKELHEGEYVNLGIGIPTATANFLPEDVHITLQSENGILKTGPYPYEDEIDPDTINAGKELVTILPGGSVFDSSTSFAMIRGGHIDTAVLGALEVSQNGDIANWAVPGQKMRGMGGAMDLVKGARRVIAVLEHTTAEKGESRVLKECTFPLTAKGVVQTIITTLGVFQVKESGLVRTELAPNVTEEDVAANTEADYTVRLG